MQIGRWSYILAFGWLVGLMALNWAVSQEQLATSPPDLSTPEKTMHALVALINAGAFHEAARCVQGGNRNPWLRELEKAAKLGGLLGFALSDFHVEIIGDQATVSMRVVASEIGEGSERKILQDRPERLRLTLWKKVGSSNLPLKPIFSNV